VSYEAEVERRRRARRGAWLNVAGIATWLLCGVPPLLEIVAGVFAGPGAIAWAAAFGVYGAALVVLLYCPDRATAVSRWAIVGLLFMQSSAGLAMTILSGNGTSAATLGIVAAILPYVVPRPVAWAWVAVQTVALGVLFGFITSWINALTAAIAIAGFQLFALASSFLARSESDARQELAWTNAELLSTRALLAENSRNQERLRISRDLHDTLGHHLTALSLQLDVASRLTDGKAADHVRQAHAITRLLLSDVRDVVSELRSSTRIDLARAIRGLTAGSSSLAIHLDMPEVVEIEEGSRADALLKCVQETITNTTRHAHARNLSITVTPDAGGIALFARDDGRGATAIAPGNGLTGMRERFETLGGRIAFRSSEGQGFHVVAFMPRRPGPSVVEGGPRS
jgi:signal transduction histidine kinase